MVPMTFPEYMAHAVAAYEFVSKKMTIGAGNRYVADQPGDLSERTSCVEDVRRKADEATAALRKDHTEKVLDDARRKWGETEDGKIAVPQETLQLYADSRLHELEEKKIEARAQIAGKHGCGNCEEQCAMVFAFLKERGVGPLDRFLMLGFVEDVFPSFGLGNHTFVILGRDRLTDPRKIGTWNSQVVWCDPYEGQLGGLPLIRQRFGSETLMLKHRWEAA